MATAVYYPSREEVKGEIMPKGFDRCVKAGGRVRTIKVKGRPRKYLHVCWIGGKSYSGHVKTKKKK